MLFRAQRPITRANYATRAPRPRQPVEGELTIVGSAGEFGSFRAAPPTFRDVRFHFEEKMRSSVGKCGDAVVSSAGHQKNLVKCSIQSRGCNFRLCNPSRRLAVGASQAAIATRTENYFTCSYVARALLRVRLLFRVFLLEFHFDQGRQRIDRLLSVRPVGLHRYLRSLCGPQRQ